MNDILCYVSLHIYLRLDLNKLRFRTIFSKDSIFVNNKNNNNNSNNNNYGQLWMWGFVLSPTDPVNLN